MNYSDILLRDYKAYKILYTNNPTVFLAFLIHYE